MFIGRSVNPGTSSVRRSGMVLEWLVLREFRSFERSRRVLLLDL
jgi:hypothetical protein